MFTHISYSQTLAYPNHHCKTPSCTIGTQFINTQDILKDCSQHPVELTSIRIRSKAMSSSPVDSKYNSRQFPSEKLEKLKKYLVFKPTSRNNRSSVPPQLKLAELKPDFPRSDGNSLMIHQYALPQGLVALRTPSPAQKPINILEDRVVPIAHPIFRKGFSGWKISMKKLIKAEKKRKFLLS